MNDYFAINWQSSFPFSDNRCYKPADMEESDDLMKAVLAKQLGGEGGVMFLESSFYLAGLIPEVPENVKIVVLWEPPDLLVKGQPPISIYSEGMQISDEGFLTRKRLELLALELSAEEHPNGPRIAEELIRIRRDHSREIVFNQPDAWLRDAASDADILFQFLLQRSEFLLFGVFLYSEMDSVFADYLKKVHKAIHSMSGSNTLLFSFGKTGELERNFEFIRSLIIASEWKKFESQHKGGVEILALDTQRKSLENFTETIYDANRSIPFAKSLGIKNTELPCLALWCDVDSEDVITYSFKNEWVATGHIDEHIKGIFDAIDSAMEDEPDGGDCKALIGKVYRRFGALKIREFVKRRVSNQSIANVLKAIGSVTALG